MEGLPSVLLATDRARELNGDVSLSLKDEIKGKIKCKKFRTVHTPSEHSCALCLEAGDVFKYRQRLSRTASTVRDCFQLLEDTLLGRLLLPYQNPSKGMYMQLRNSFALMLERHSNCSHGWMPWSILFLRKLKKRYNH